MKNYLENQNLWWLWWWLTKLRFISGPCWFFFYFSIYFIRSQYNNIKENNSLAVLKIIVGKIGQKIETIRKYLIANFSGVDFWTSPYTNGTVDFMISPKEYTRVVRHLQHEKIPFKVNKNMWSFFWRSTIYA